MADEKQDKKEIEVVSGDGSNLDISPVYEHIDAAKPKNKDKKPQNIVIPGQKKEDSND
ncbi:MAG: hypothetical protein IJE68_04180 [Clostridia bacterium]|nr:hypothetical protein [Clostridia bacterium]